ncbi:MAG: AI-2E family transporter [Flavobacteriaceae bacterium]
MTVSQQVRIWLFALLAAGIVLYLLRGILLPFVAGMALAYSLDPVADRLERRGFSRMAATVTILGIFALIFLLALLALVPVLISQLSGFAERLPSLINNLQSIVASLSETLRDSWLAQYVDFGAPGETGGQLGTMLGAAGNWLAGLAASLLSGGLAFVNLMALLVVTPVVAFYLLLDWDNMVAKIDFWLPREHVQTIRGIMRDIDSALAGFVRGQGSVCILLGAFYAAGLSLAGLNFGLLIGLGAGLISFIPYVGSIVGLLVALSVAAVQFWPDWVMIAVIAGIFFAGQFIEGNILQPKLVGGQIGLHPVWLMFALFAFGLLFGFVGMLLAVPISAAIGVVARFGLNKYLSSPLYRGGEGDGAGDGGGDAA